MNVQQSYDAWSNSYDTMANKTRDLEATALQAMLANIQPTSILELGCGTGKNTQWLMGRTSTLTAVDFSQAMLAKARERISAPHVRFIQADLLQPWHFATAPVGLAICSLVLEHIEHLLPFFEQVAQVLEPGGFFYIGELHPFKQYTGSKAKFDTGKDLVELDSFVHHVSDFTGAAAKAGLQVVSLQEWFDTDDRSSEPRILALLFQKPL